MRYYLISDNLDTLTGLRLAGIEGAIAHSALEVRECLQSVLSDAQIGVLLITEKLANLCPDIIHTIKSERHSPLLVSIPDRHGSDRESDSITKYVREAIGIKI